MQVKSRVLHADGSSCVQFEVSQPLNHFSYVTIKLLVRNFLTIGDHGRRRWAMHGVVANVTYSGCEHIVDASIIFSEPSFPGADQSFSLAVFYLEGMKLSGL